MLYDTVSKVKNALKVEHLGVHGQDKWMTIPDMGYPSACRYNAVFVSMSKRLNISFFPFTLAPPMYTSMRTIINVGFVNDNHWVQIKLKPDSSLPHVTYHWRQNYTEDAKAWESTYTRRIRH